MNADAAGPLNLLSPSVQETERIGTRLADTLPPLTAQPAIVYLTGPLGAGKTTLARGFLAGRGFSETVRSPTYTLLECYELSDLVVVHLDLYRIEAASELEALGIREFLTANHVLLIEWPERGVPGLPAPDLSVAMQVQSAHHEIGLRGDTALGAAWLRGLVELLASSS